jgi:hypothetical protein
MLSFGVTILATVQQRSKNPGGTYELPCIRVGFKPEQDYFLGRTEMSCMP